MSQSVCPASYEAVTETADFGCPLCGRGPEAHHSEWYLSQRTHHHDWKPVGLDSQRCDCGATKTAIV